jgi:hypothetical protein
MNFFAYDGSGEFLDQEHIQSIQGEGMMAKGRDKSGYNASILTPETMAGKYFAKKNHRKGLRSLKNLKLTRNCVNLPRSVILSLSQDLSGNRNSGG